MRFETKPDDEKNEPNGYLGRVDYGYVFRLTGGLYQPELDHRAIEKPKTAAQSVGNIPIAIKVETQADWVSHVISLAAILVSIVTLILLAATVYFTQKQWIEANRNAIASERSADSANQAVVKAQDAIDQARAQFVQDRRPYVWHSAIKAGPTPPSRLEADVYWVNYGRSPAIRFATAGKIFCGKNALSESYSFLEKTQASREWSNRGSVIAPFVPSEAVSMVLPHDSFVSEPLTADNIELCNTSDPNIIVGAMEYYDAEGNRYTGEFCTGFRFRVSRGYLASGNCPKHNNM